MSPESKNSSFWNEGRRLEGRKHNLRLRSSIIKSIREFFFKQDYLEVETPLLIPAPAPEVHIDAISSGNLFLHTSPELCMKRLLAAGYSKIFQISKCFRKGERGNLHMPEFTILEWYRSGIDYNKLMGECEELFIWISKSIGLGNRIKYKGKEFDLSAPWERLSVREAFERHASIPLATALDKDLFDETLVNDIEPHLGVHKPTFLYDYPPSMSSLAKLNNDNNLAERFEIYMAGLELANGFSELNDVKEQRARFEIDNDQRDILGKQRYPVSERFLSALEYMPEASGIALGVDRLVMIFADKTKIDDVVSFTPEEL
jgi:lysyl-tRNA synthetase class 2